MNDADIIALYWGRDEQALRETNAKYGPYCYAVAQNILFCREDSEECVSDTWLRCWNAIPPRRPADLRFFLAKITRNLSFDRFKAKHAARRGGGETPLVLDELARCIPAASSREYTDLELRDSIGRFLHSLPARECGIFLRRYFFTESVAAIAARYRITESNVLVILSRTRKKLRTHLESEGHTI